MGFILFIAAVLWWKDSLPQRTAQSAPAAVATVAREPEQKAEIDPKLEAILLQWGRAMENVERVECQFQRYRYDEIFHDERRSKGHLSIGRDSAGDYVMEPAVIPPGTVSRRKNGSEPFSLKSEGAEAWVFTKQGVNLSRGKEKISVPDFVIEHPLAPFLLNVSRRELISKFDVKLVRQTPDQIHLEFVPRRQQPWQWSYSSVELILKPKGFVPYALKLIDPAGNSSTVHVLSDVKYVFKASE